MRQEIKAHSCPFLSVFVCIGTGANAAGFLMPISKKSMDRFKKLYKERFGKELSDKDALRKALYLLEIFRAVYGDTSSGQNFDNIDNKKER